MQLWAPCKWKPVESQCLPCLSTQGIQSLSRTRIWWVQSWRQWGCWILMTKKLYKKYKIWWLMIDHQWSLVMLTCADSELLITNLANLTWGNWQKFISFKMFLASAYIFDYPEIQIDYLRVKHQSSMGALAGSLRPDWRIQWGLADPGRPSQDCCCQLFRLVTQFFEDGHVVPVKQMDTEYRVVPTHVGTRATQF